MTKDKPERRLYARIPVDIIGEIKVGGRDPIPCRIRDLCQNGLLLECAVADDDLAYRLNAQILIRFELPSQNGQDLIQTWIELLQRGDGLFGARFLRLSNAESAKLDIYLKTPRQVPAVAGAVSSGIVNTALAILRRITLRSLEDITQPALEEMREALWYANERAKSDAERNDIASDIAHLERAVQQRRFQEQIRRDLLDTMVQQEVNHASTQTFTGANADLTLVDTDSFETWLAISALVERLERQLCEPLNALRLLSTGVFGNTAIISIEPQGLSQALRRALETTGISTQGQLTCLRSTAKSLPITLSSFYLAITEAWINSGLTPKSINKLRTEVPRKNPAQKAPASATNTKSGLTPQSARTHTHKKAATNPESPISGKTIPKNSVVSAQLSATNLTSMLAADDTIPASGEAVRAHIAALLSKNFPATKLPPVLEERVDVTGHMLTSMLTDQGVPSEAKELIRQISMRVLAAAVDEPGFFATSQHPLSVVLDRLEHLAMFLPTSGTSKNTVQQTIELLMHKAARTSPKDIATLNDISNRLANIQQQLGEKWQNYAEQVVSNCEGRERIRLAQNYTRSKINEIFAGQLIHPVILSLIQNAWRALLQITWIKEGEDSATWQNYWQVLKELHRICANGDATLTEEQILNLLKTIRLGLRTINFDPYQYALLEERIEGTLRIARFRPPKDKIAFESIPMPKDEMPEETPDVDINSQEWIQALATVNELEIGANLRLQQGNKETNQRLTWRSSDGRNLVFIEPVNLKSKTITRNTLAQAFYNKSAQTQAPASGPLVSRTTEATLKQMQQRIRYHETHDTITGLSNRRQLNGILTELISGATSSVAADDTKPKCCDSRVLGFLDLDRFNAMTGICGYNAGEQLLTIVARTLKKLFENEKPICIAFLGGSRFAFLLQTATAETAEYLGQRVRESLATTPFYWQGTSYSLSVSVGLVLVTTTAENPETLLSAADTACMTAQRNGGGKVVMFREGNADIFRHQQLMRDWIQAEAAVKSRRLRLRGQRIAVTASPEENPHHYEILLSVYDEHGTQLPLDAFIAAAEAFNLMVEIDKLVFAQALEWVHDNPAQARALGGVAINLSGQSLSDRTLVDLVQNSLKHFAIPPQLISFEVTETTAIANLDQAAAIIMGIKDIGCHFALDDFGAGLSSYSYLKRLPVDYIKIDGSFIKDILSNPNDQIIVKSINEVAHFMGKQTIAEYVENWEILKRLQEIGVDYVQGYVVGKPQFLDEVR